MEKRDLTNNELEIAKEQVDSSLIDVIKHFNTFTYLIHEGWSIAEDIKGITNLTDKDSIHLAEALSISCHIFLTRDQFLLNIARNYIFSANPDEIMDILQ